MEGKTKKTTQNKQARVLLDCTIDGDRYTINALLDAPASVVDAAEKAGKVDTSKGAVARAKG